MQYNAAMFAGTLTTTLFTALARLLATQPALRARLIGHASKHVRLRLPLAAVAFRITEDGNLAVADPALPIATDILVPPDILFMLVAGQKDALAKAGVEGDGTLAADLSAALSEFDWALALRPVVGDIAAARTAQAVDRFGQWRMQALEAIGRSIAEYVTYETGLLADKAAVRRFVAEVDTLRDDVARLEARIALLEQRGT
jgi:ubiquinone biosynthesis protein UbiJ